MRSGIHAIVDAIMSQDPYGRVTCETCVTTDLILVTGDITTCANVDIQKIVKDTINEIGDLPDFILLRC